MYKRSTLVVAILVAFAFGLFAGLLTFSIMGEGAGGQRSAATGVAPQGRGNMSASLGSPELAALRQAVQNDKTDVQAWNHLGHWYYDNNMPKEAISAYENSLILRPDDPDVITDLGIMYRNVHEHEKALELFQEAARLNPKHVQSRFNIGVVLYFDLQRHDEGLKAWEELAKIAPDFVTGNGQTISDWVRQLKARQK